MPLLFQFSPTCHSSFFITVVGLFRMLTGSQLTPHNSLNQKTPCRQSSPDEHGGVGGKNCISYQNSAFIPVLGFLREHPILARVTICDFGW